MSCESCEKRTPSCSSKKEVAKTKFGEGGGPGRLVLYPAYKWVGENRDKFGREIKK